MNEKIALNDKLELYRELLEIDPFSRVFFLYAQMLDQSGQMDEALLVLARGLEKHPDYLEARLYYIELLAKKDKYESANIQLHKFTDVFKKYPSFWQTWSTLAADENAAISSTLALLSAFFANPTLTLMDIFQAGIQHYADLGTNQPHTTQAQHVQNALNMPLQHDESMVTPDITTEHAELQEQTSVFTQNQNDVEEQEVLTLSQEQEADFAPTFPETLEETPLQAEFSEEPSEAVFEELPTDFTSDVIIEESIEETFEQSPKPENGNGKASTHTKSMAELLATQGDTAGAIAIYTELLDEADDVQKEELLAKINELNGNTESHNELSGEKQPTQADSTSGLSPKMQNMLEKLAQRLEKRAQV